MNEQIEKLTGELLQLLATKAELHDQIEEIETRVGQIKAFLEGVKAAQAPTEE